MSNSVTRAMKLVSALGIAVLASQGCSSTEEAQTTTRERTPLAIASAHAEVATRLSERASIPSSFEVTSPKQSGPWQSLRSIYVARIPRTSVEPLRIADPENDGVWIELAVEDARDTTGTLADDVVTHRDVAIDTDAIYFAAREGVEELRVLRTAQAPRSTTYRVRTGVGIASLRIDGDRVLASDASGTDRLASAPVVAWDAKGRRRTPSLRIDGDRLVVTLSTDGLEFPVTVDPLWTAIAPLSNHRSHGAVRLADGRVWIAGNDLGSVGGTAAEIFDPSTDSYTSVAAMPTGRHSFVAALLADGRVLAAGGAFGAKAAERYNPSTNTWTTAASMLQNHQDAAFGVLPSGNVIAAGGVFATSTCEIYDPIANTWTATASMAAGRDGAPGIVLSSGAFLVVGGRGSTGNALSTAELWTAGAWSAAGTMSAARYVHTATLLASGKVLVTGGQIGTTTVTYLSSAELWDPSTKTFSAVPSMSSPRAWHSATRLPNGNVLVTGGHDGITIRSTAEIYDPVANVWKSIPNMGIPRAQHTSTLLTDGRVVIAGSFSTDIFKQLPNGTKCGVSAECSSLFCVDGVCCDGACTGQCFACDVTGSVGTCRTVTGATHGTRPTCAPYACNAGVCVTSCGVDDSLCASGYYCLSGVCTKGKADGSACSKGPECASGSCVDSVCCESSCAAQCYACDLTGKVGSCSPVTGAPHGSRGSCAPYFCAAGACAATCALDADCTTGNYCDGTSCVPRKALGAGCSKTSECTSGNCVDGFCCDGACTESCNACDVAGKAGTCSPVASGAPHGTKTSCAPYLCVAGACGTSCTTSAACAGGGTCVGSACIPRKALGETCAATSECVIGSTCVDSVCCDTACNGQCEACDVSGSKGKCSPVAGAPHGTRPACDDGGSNKCHARTCDGAIDTKTCAAFVSGPTTSCRAASCDGEKLLPAWTCDGKGACKETAAVSCAPFSCDAGKCRTSCATTDECAPGFLCRESACVPRAGVSTCTADGKSSIAADGTVTECNAYRCGKDGKCTTRCSSSDDCAAGNSCDVASGTCTPPTLETDSGGGCTTHAGGRTTWSPLLLLVLGALVRRRRSIARPTNAAIALGLASIVVATARCTPSSSEPDTKRTTIHAQIASGESALGTLRRWSVLRAMIDPAARLESHGDALRLRPRASAWSWEGIDIDLPSRAGAPLRIADRLQPEVFVEIVPQDVVTSGAPEREGSAIAFRRALGDVDIAYLAQPVRAEEVHLVRASATTYVARHILRVGSGVSDVRLHDGVIEVLDRAGRAAIISEQVVAFDANGERRTGAISLVRVDRPSEWAIITRVDLRGLALPIAIDPAWKSVGVASRPYMNHTATPLPSGAVIMVNGQGSSAAPLDVYDPSTSAWSLTGDSIANYRSQHAAVLALGKVLVMGGYGIGVPISSAEIYDPTPKTWSASASMTAARVEPVAVTLSDGRVLVAGGLGSAGSLSTAEIFSSGSFVATGSMSAARAGAIGVLLADGRVLVTGGTATGGISLSTAEIWSPTTSTWTAAASMSAARTRHVAARLPSGKVLASHGGATSAELYDPSTNTWTATAAVIDTRTAPRFAPLTTGRVLVAGGVGTSFLSSTEIYDPTSATWYPAGDLALALRDHAMAPLTTGRAFVGGGFDGADATGLGQVFTPLTNGTACTQAGECASLACVDGVCCDTTCAGNCQACDLTGSIGTCTSVTGLPHGTRTCGAYYCAAGVCATTCSVESDCLPGNWCGGGKCLPKKPIAGTCTVDRECTSGFCADGVCCDKACTAQCDACDVSGKVGTCFPVSGTPHGGRASCAPYLCVAGACGTGCSTDASCASGYYCNGTTCVAKKGSGAACTKAGECTSGFCAEGYCCNTACTEQCRACDIIGKVGTCSPVDGPVHGTKPACAPYACVAGVCPTGCTKDADCASDSFCDTSGCKKKEAIAGACKRDGECGSGFCADGRCCDKACAGLCEACDLAGKEGTCFPVTGAPHGTRKCDDGGGDPCAARSCDGAKDSNKCLGFVASTSTECRAASCSGTKFTAKSTCDGAGSCQTPDATSCVPFACDATGCRKDCTTNDHCAPGFLCSKSKCIAADSICSSDELSMVGKDAKITSCGKYRCRDGACLDACTASSDCAPDHVCDLPSRACIPNAAPETESSGGCSTTSSSGEGSAHGYVALLLVLSLARRRRSRSS